MRWTLGLIAPTLAAMVTLAPIPAHASTPALAAPAAASSDVLALANFALVNTQRLAAGVAPLQVQSWAQGVAQAHSIDMANANNIFHNMTGYMALGRSAMGASYLGENVAMGTNIDYAQNALLTSPLHMKNMLDPRFNYVGIGAATDDSGQVFITEDFAQIGAAARPAAPAVVSAPPVAAAAAQPVAPKPVVAAAPKLVVASVPKPVVAPKPAVTAPAAPAPVAIAAAAAPKPAQALAPLADHAMVPVASMKVAAHTSRVSAGAFLLYGMLGLLAASFTLGLGYKLTRFLPGR